VGAAIGYNSAMPDFRPAMPLAGRTTLGVGGAARYLVECADDDSVRGAIAFARDAGLPLRVLGGGSNIVVADDGFPGVVCTIGDRTLTLDGDRLQLGGGASWDDAVRAAVDGGLSGIECLSGIPGTAGAAPVQNIGAYGQELAETFESLDAIDLRDGVLRTFGRSDCGFGYRRSRWKHDEAGRYAIVRVVLRLSREAPKRPSYPDLAARLGDAPDLPCIRAAVLAVRRGKSMLISPDDPDSRSVGSFFTNPVVDAATVARLRAVHPGIPSWDQPDGAKLSAAWLIERSGFPRGFSDGPAGVSRNHTLALVNRGGARAIDVLRLAARVRRRVWDTFAVRLHPEAEEFGYFRPLSDVIDGIAP
jgi:UDP-N-acetylmuramate dehydrogenase